ncbi:MAG: response regulator [Curvibacter sp.]|nr:response regulator [Curvibacter sp.]
MAHILVVDDSSTMRELVAGFLRRHQFEVSVAIDGVDGLQQLKLDPGLRLIVCDINMPNMDGLTMAEKIRTELNNREVHIIMLTTEDNPAMRDRGRQIGVTGWIVKPFKGEAVLGAFRRLCGLS